MSSEDVLLMNDTHSARAGWRDVDVGNDQLCMVCSFRCVSDSDSADDGCLENVTDLWVKMSNPPPWRGVVLDVGVLGFWKKYRSSAFLTTINTRKAMARLIRNVSN